MGVNEWLGLALVVAVVVASVRAWREQHAPAQPGTIEEHLAAYAADDRALAQALLMRLDGVPWAAQAKLAALTLAGGSVAKLADLCDMALQGDPRDLIARAGIR